MLTKAAKYAIRASLYLGLHSSRDHKINVKKIADDLDVPTPFLAKQLQLLSRSKLISSTKGPQGGFYLSDNNRSKSLWDVILCIDGEEKFNECFLGKEECSDEHPCAVHHMVILFKSRMMKEFRDKNIAHLVEQLRKNKSISL